VQDTDRGLAELEHLSVLERVELELRRGGGVDGDRNAVLERKAPVPGDVVGVSVCLEHADDPSLALLCLLEVLLDCIGGIGDHRVSGGLVADQVGRAAEIVVDELAKEHVKNLTGCPA
jgi:hypothetical protein